MAPHLEDCPEEIVANIVQRLDLHDIGSLRHTSRPVAGKCTTAYFKSLFLSKRVELTEPMLKKFAEVTQPGSLGCLIQELTLVGVSKGPEGSTYKEEEISKSDKTELLTQVFSGIFINSPAARLSSLSLEVTITDKIGQRSLPGASHFSWKCRWQSARDTFDIAWHALAASKLPIEKLNLFNTRQMQQCSLPSNCLGAVDWTAPDLPTSLASLKSLSISLCPRDLNAFEMKDDGEGPHADGFEHDPSLKSRNDDNIQAEADDELNFSGLAHFLRLCGQLDNFELHYFIKFSYGYGDIDHHYQRLLQRVAETDRLPRIQYFRLRGVYARERDLLALVQRTRTSNLSMENVSCDTFRKIFDHCQSSTSPVEAVYFDDLNESDGMVYFDAPGPQKFLRLIDVEGCPTLQRTGADVKQPISYVLAVSRALGSPEATQWRQDRRREYGR